MANPARIPATSDNDLLSKAANLEAWSWFEEIDKSIDALPERSGERTKFRLMRATAELMAAHDDPIRAASINKQAHTAQGTFYVHFDDASLAERAVVDSLLAFRDARLPDLDGSGDAFEGVFKFIDIYTRVYAANADLFRGLMARVDRDPEMALLRQGYNKLTIGRIVRDMKAREISKDVSPQTQELAVWTAGTLLEDSLYATLAVKRSQRRLDLAGSLEGLIDMMATLFYRSLYAPVSADVQTSTLKDAALLGAAPRPDR